MGYYLTAQVCGNGHHTTSSVEHSPNLMANFCDKCGSETMTKCPSCSTKIRGKYYVDDFAIIGQNYTAPSFCHACGKAFPWTTTKIEAAKEMVEEIDELSPDEREKLKGAIDDIVIEGARTELGANRFKKLLTKMGSASASAMRDIVVDVISETAKKIIFP
ncbi:DUF2321 domain-containing protein [Rhodospirillum rubrum]|nr:DUF2321 domain-containing protein [Rhodospirillum rubrum]QXG79671.1 DUF2321 domain-containing protein [Rhodospirillum rubrum]